MLKVEGIMKKVSHAEYQELSVRKNTSTGLQVSGNKYRVTIIWKLVPQNKYNKLGLASVKFHVWLEFLKIL